MKAELTNALDIVLSWNDAGHSKVTWSVRSGCEFTVSASLLLSAQLHHQGPTRVEFQTVCYAVALKNFADSLEEFLHGRSDSAVYQGSQDMQIIVESRQGKGDFKGSRVVYCRLEYEPFRHLDGVVCESKIGVALGALQQGDAVVRAIREALELLKMDTRSEAGS